jgi:hypothetical protein
VNTGALLHNDGTQEICLMGQHLLPGTTVAMGVGQNDDVPVRATVNAEGTVFCFAPPHGIDEGEHSIFIGRPGMDAQDSGQRVIVTTDGAGEPDDDPDDDPDDEATHSIYLPVLLR